MAEEVVFTMINRKPVNPRCRFPLERGSRVSADLSLGDYQSPCRICLTPAKPGREDCNDYDLPSHSRVVLTTPASVTGFDIYFVPPGLDVDGGRVAVNANLANLVEFETSHAYSSAPTCIRSTATPYCSSSVYDSTLNPERPVWAVAAGMGDFPFQPWGLATTPENVCPYLSGIAPSAAVYPLFDVGIYRIVLVLTGALLQDTSSGSPLSRSLLHASVVATYESSAVDFHHLTFPLTLSLVGTTPLSGDMTVPTTIRLIESA